MNVGEANRVRACLDCGEPDALLWRTTKGENAGRLLRICAACLRKDDWHRFGLVERQPILGEVPTEFFEGEWHFPKADDPEPWAVITYTDEPSPETGHVGWCWWAMGSMGDAPSYEAACDAAVAEIQRRMTAEWRCCDAVRREKHGPKAQCASAPTQRSAHRRVVERRVSGWNRRPLLADLPAR